MYLYVYKCVCVCDILENYLTIEPSVFKIMITNLYDIYKVWYLLLAIKMYELNKKE